METDWEVEIGGESPVIEALWPGFVDLRCTPQMALQLAEAAQFPALADALIRLNTGSSSLWTSKCDLWPVTDFAQFDPDELDAPPGCALQAIGCYIDLLPGSGQQWPNPAIAASICTRICGLLRAVPLRCCRADLVIRRAFIAPEQMDLGITAYLTACGESLTEVERTLQVALTTLVDVLCALATLQ